MLSSGNGSVVAEDANLVESPAVKKYNKHDALALEIEHQFSTAVDEVSSAEEELNCNSTVNDILFENINSSIYKLPDSYRKLFELKLDKLKADHKVDSEKLSEIISQSRASLRSLRIKFFALYTLDDERHHSDSNQISGTSDDEYLFVDKCYHVTIQHNQKSISSLKDEKLPLLYEEIKVAITKWENDSLSIIKECNKKLKTHVDVLHLELLEVLSLKAKQLEKDPKKDDDRLAQLEKTIEDLKNQVKLLTDVIAKSNIINKTIEKVESPKPVSVTVSMLGKFKA